MRKIAFSLTLLIACVVSTTSAENDHKGIVSFNLGESPVSNSPVQPVTLYGCNQRVDSNLFWGAENQVVGNIPYGNYTSGLGKDYYVSKYYISSPPVFRKGLKNNSKKQQPFIGLVTPDSFSFTGAKPAQIVYFDYRILESTHLDFISVNYDSKNKGKNSCSTLGVDLIPLNIHCPDFPWRNGGVGASGIGDITQKNNHVFLPLIGDDKKPLQCNVSILDDIVLHHDIYFLEEDGSKHKTVNLTKHYLNKKDINLVCQTRKKSDTPFGCQP